MSFWLLNGFFHYSLRVRYRHFWEHVSFWLYFFHSLRRRNHFRFYFVIYYILMDVLLKAFFILVIVIHYFYVFLLIIYLFILIWILDLRWAYLSLVFLRKEISSLLVHHILSEVVIIWVILLCSAILILILYYLILLIVLVLCSVSLPWNCCLNLIQSFLIVYLLSLVHLALSALSLFTKVVSLSSLGVIVKSTLPIWDTRQLSYFLFSHYDVFLDWNSFVSN